MKIVFKLIKYAVLLSMGLVGLYFLWMLGVALYMYFTTETFFLLII